MALVCDEQGSHSRPYWLSMAWWLPPQVHYVGVRRCSLGSKGSLLIFSGQCCGGWLTMRPQRDWATEEALVNHSILASPA